jgi:hypothetical protein
MNIIQIADGAFFVRSYSEKTIIAAYSTSTTLQGLAGTTEIYDDNSPVAADTDEKTMIPQIISPRAT